MLHTRQLPMSSQGSKIKLQLPDIAEPLKISCEVVWSRKPGDYEKGPPGMGVKFREMSGNDRQILDKYLKEVTAP